MFYTAVYVSVRPLRWVPVVVTTNTPPTIWFRDGIKLRLACLREPTTSELSEYLRSYRPEEDVTLAGDGVPNAISLDTLRQLRYKNEVPSTFEAIWRSLFD
jgi:hypothetical protein